MQEKDGFEEEIAGYDIISLGFDIDLPAFFASQGGAKGSLFIDKQWHSKVTMFII